MPRPTSALALARRLRRCFRDGGGARAADALCDALERRHGRKKLDAVLDELEIILEGELPDGVRFQDFRWETLN